MLDLLRDTSWNLRRVETLSLLDQNRIERRVTLDVDLREIRTRLARQGFKNPPLVYVPVLIQVKTLMLDADFRAPDGTSLPLLTSAQDSWLAYSMLLCVASEHAMHPEKFSRPLREAIYRVVRHLPEEAELRDIERIDSLDSVDQIAEYWRAQSTHLLSDNDDRDTWIELFRVPEFVNLAADFTLKSMAVVGLPLGSESVCMIKYRLVDVGSSTDLAGIEAWGFDNFNYFVPTHSIGSAQREHIRFVAPQGMEVTNVSLWERPSKPVQSPLPIHVSGKTFHSRVAAERGVVYTRRFVRGNYVLGVGLQPRVEELTAPALFSVGLTTTLLGVFAALQFLHGSFNVFPDEEGLLGSVDTDSLTTTLLLVPTLLSLFLIRPREHSLVSRMLLRLRVLVLATAFCMIVCASAVALGVQSWLLGAIFAAGFAVSAGALVVLIVAFARAKERARQVRFANSRVAVDNVLVSQYLP